MSTAVLMRRLAEQDEAQAKQAEQAVIKAFTAQLQKAAGGEALAADVIAKGLAQLKAKAAALGGGAQTEALDLAGWKAKIAALAKAGLSKAKDPATVASALISTASVIIGSQGKLTDMMGEGSYKALLDSITITIEMLVNMAKGKAAERSDAKKAAEVEKIARGAAGRENIAASLDQLVSNLLEGEGDEWSEYDEPEPVRDEFGASGLSGEEAARELSTAVQQQDDLSGQNFSELDLPGIRLAGAKVAGADFSGTNLVDADLSEIDGIQTAFTGANLQNARFDGANLRDAVFADADLRGAVFRGAIIRDAIFAGADLRGADFSGVDLRGTELEMRGGGEVEWVGSASDDEDEDEEDDDEIPASGGGFRLHPREASRLSRMEGFSGALDRLLSERIRTFQMVAGNQLPTRRQGAVMFVFTSPDDAEEAALAIGASLGDPPAVGPYGSGWGFTVPYPIAGSLDAVLRRNGYQRRL